MEPMTTISLDDDLVKELQALADREGKKPADLVRQLLTAYAERQRYLAAIDEGIAAANAGQVIDGDRVDAWLASWGTDNELDPPT
jgi:predicted transcriptional regulator